MVAAVRAGLGSEEQRQECRPLVCGISLRSRAHVDLGQCAAPERRRIEWAAIRRQSRHKSRGHARLSFPVPGTLSDAIRLLPAGYYTKNRHGAGLERK